MRTDRPAFQLNTCETVVCRYWPSHPNNPSNPSNTPMRTCTLRRRHTWRAGSCGRHTRGCWPCAPAGQAAGSRQQGVDCWKRWRQHRERGAWRGAVMTLRSHGSQEGARGFGCCGRKTALLGCSPLSTTRLLTTLLLPRTTHLRDQHFFGAVDHKVAALVVGALPQVAQVALAARAQVAVVGAEHDGHLQV